MFPSPVANATIVTACFYIDPETRIVDDCKRSTEALMQVPAKMVIYADETLGPHCLIQRQKWGLESLTDVRIMRFEDIWTYKFAEKVTANREAYWPTRDSRAKLRSHLLVCNKFDFMLQAIDRNVFSTSHFVWFDAMIAKTTPEGVLKCKISEKEFSASRVLRLLHNLRDQFQVTVMNVNSKEFARPENWREFYTTYRYVVCGGVFSLRNVPKNIEILEFLKENFVRHTEAGYGHGEEMFYHEALDVYYDDMYRSYGDYGQILDNWLHPTRNLPYLFWAVVQRYVGFGYWREAEDVCTKILHPFLYHENTDESYGTMQVYCRVMYALFVATWHRHGRERASIVRRSFYDLVDAYAWFRTAYLENQSFYDVNFQASDAPPANI